MRKIAFAIVLSIAFTQPVLARSCSQQAALCADWARKNAPTLERACMVEISACVNRCKKGDKRYIGVYQGKDYPIQECN